MISIKNNTENGFVKRYCLSDLFAATFLLLCICDEGFLRGLTDHQKTSGHMSNIVAAPVKHE